MELISIRWAAKVATATVGGLITIFFGPWAAVFLTSGAKCLPEPWAFAHLSIGLGALAGIIAFWVWVFGREPVTSQRRRALSICIACGMIAALTVIVRLSIRGYFEFDVITSALILSLLVGVSVIASLWLKVKQGSSVMPHKSQNRAE
jgi:hypothetical protein